MVFNEPKVMDQNCCLEPVAINMFDILFSKPRCCFLADENETSSFVNPNNLITSDQPSLNESLGTSESPSGFVANGKINTVIDVPNGKWIATGTGAL
jgi:hypothetical protein